MWASENERLTELSAVLGGRRRRAAWQEVGLDVPRGAHRSRSSRGPEAGRIDCDRWFESDESDAVNYPLKEVGEFVMDGDRKIGIMIRCPNCQMLFSAWFRNPIGGGEAPHRVSWDRLGDTLETLSLTPSFMAVQHFHSWIRNGELRVDSAFTCPPIDPEHVA